MSAWQGYAEELQTLLANNSYAEAQIKVQEGLEKIPNQVNLLVIATDVYRRSGELEKSLEFAESLITQYPDNWAGYGRAAQILVALKRFDDAQTKIMEGLEKIPNQVNLLVIATDVYRRSGELEKSLEFAESLITQYPDNWAGYGRAAENLVALKRFDDAQTKIMEGLEKAPNHIMLQKIADYVSSYTPTFDITPSNAIRRHYLLSATDLVAYSKDPDYFRVIQDKRTIPSQECKFDKKLLFVAGLGRSGTSALGRMLSISKDLEMYIELYTGMRVNGYTKHDFTDDAILEAIRNRQNKEANLNIFRRFRRSFHSKVIGDKQPDFHFVAESTFNNFQKGIVKVLFIERSLHDVCRSAHKRSEDPDDTGWKLERGIEHTVLFYNASCRQIIHLHRNCRNVFDSITFLQYEKVFSDFEFAKNIFVAHDLVLDTTAEKDLELFIEKSTMIASRSRVGDDLSLKISTAISKYLDHSAHELFCEITGITRTY